MTEEPTIEERLALCEEAIIQLQEAYNNLVQLAVRSDREETIAKRVGTRGAARCKVELSSNYEHLCIWGISDLTGEDCKACLNDD